MNGSYVGVLKEVVPNRPWRGRVRLDGVLECWCIIGPGGSRRGLRLGEVYEFGGVNIKPDTRPGMSKEQALLAELRRTVQWRREARAGRCGRRASGYPFRSAVRSIVRQIRALREEVSS